MADKLISFSELVKEFNTHCGSDCEFCDHHLRVHGKSKTRCLILNSLRAADAVEVVRCRECIHRGDAYCPMCHEEYHFDEDDGTEYVTRDYTEDDGFCHCGAKMDGGAS